MVNAKSGVKYMKVLVACEFSGTVRDAFREKGCDAWSCDLLGPDDIPLDVVKRQKWPDYHLEGNVLDFLDQSPGGGSWDIMIAHPPCTHLAVSGARWFKDKQKEQGAALEFVRALLEVPIARIALENPIGIISSKVRKPDQIIQPWQFGHGETKATCLWLKNLPPLEPTKIVEGRETRVHRMPPGPDRWKYRSLTCQGIADAMADQWCN